MNNEKKVFESPEIKIVLLDRDMLLTSAGTLSEDGWDLLSFDFESL